MDNNQIINQKIKDGMWIDENDIEIPVSRINKSERINERYSAKILKEASNLNKRIKAFKEMVRLYSQEAYDAFMLEKNIDPNKKRKGNFTWYNFNRTIKIEVSVNEPIKFDDLGIKAAKIKLDEFLEKDITSKTEFAKQMIIDSFETQRSGQLDVSKVMRVVSYESKIKSPLFSEAVTLIKEAIRRPKSKTYFRVWKRDLSGAYQNIDLNFSSI